MERVIDPLIADVQHEYARAAQEGRIWRSHAIHVAGWIACLKVLGIRRVLEEHRRRLRHKSADRRRERVLDFLERSVWPTLPKRERGRRLTRAEEDEILGYGRGGV